jgi:enhancing lycopene biosynthesis protein 2
MEKKQKFAVILAGSGVFDGSEIHETTLSLYSIMKNGGEYEIFAPDIDQHHVINHITGEEMNEKRNVLIEASRIARGQIKDLKEFKADHFDAILMPGGFGAAKNLSTFAFDGPNCKINEDVEKAIKETKAQNKPIGALCISPVIVAKILGDVQLTIGQDEDTANAVEQMGAKHEKTNHGEVVMDKANNVFTTPCYMLDANILQIGEGADNVVKAMMDAM